MEEIDLSQELIDFAIKIHDRQMMHLESNGRIEKTIFILDYISNEELRRRIQKGLNKGEAANALERAIFFCQTRRIS